DRHRERIVMLESHEKGLVATTLHYAYEIGDAAEYFGEIPDIKLPGEMVEFAEHILDTKAGHFDASEFEDRYENAVVEMLKRKQAGMPIERQPEAAPPGNVVNLMDAGGEASCSPSEAMEMGNLLRREETADRAVTRLFPVHGKG